MKKRIGIYALLLLVLTGCAGDTEYLAGTYEGEGWGYNKEKPIRLSVTIGEDHEIYEMKILQTHETEEIGNKALDALIQEALKKNGEKVDIVTGATRTSEGFNEALEKALEQAKEK